MMRRFTLFGFSAFLLAFTAGCGGGGTASSGGSGGSTPGTAGFTVSGLTFASTAVSSSAGAQTLTFNNGTTAAISITNVVLTGNNGLTDYSITSNTCTGTLAAAASCTVSVNFSPIATGTRVGTISVVDNAANSPQLASLTGTGSAPLADLEPQNGLTFGTTVVASTATSQTATLTNTGSAAMTISSIAFTGTNPGDFSENNNCGSSLAAAASCTITVNFTPVATGARAASLTVTDNSGDGTDSINVTGTGAATAAPVALLSTTSLSFTSSTAQVVTLSNTGASAMTITGITITGTNPTNFAETNNCGTSLASSASCTISVTFAPSGSGSYGASLNVADNAAGSPQTVALTGTVAPVATFSVSSLTFTESTVNTTTAAQTVTLTNTGTASMTGVAVSLAGTTPGSFAQTNTCASTLAVNANCTISVTFKPTANGTVNATVSVADNATGSPQTVTLNGYGPGTTTLSQTLVTEGLNGDFSSIYALINGATSTIDMTMYELTDATATADLIAAMNRGVTVRVILDTSEKNNNTTDYNRLIAAGVPTVYSNTHFVNTHQKSIEVDSAIPSKAEVCILTANLSSQYYSTSRDFLLFENDPADIAAIEATFQEDYTFSTGTTYPSFTPNFGDDLVWSYASGGSTAATTPRQKLLSVINSAQHTLILDEEEMSDSGITAALAAQAHAGVSVKMSITSGGSSSQISQMNTMKTAGVQIVQYPSSGNHLYIHAKVIIADQGTATEQAFLGSENISSNSLQNNRELGLIMTDSTSPQSQSIIQTLNTVLTSDFSCPSGYGCAAF
jgi:phosphatidylserine/phosphatidylglycerophosphate/cardiolipin synthase-like enzyme